MLKLVISLIFTACNYDHLVAAGGLYPSAIGLGGGYLGGGEHLGGGGLLGGAGHLGGIGHIGAGGGGGGHLGAGHFGGGQIGGGHIGGGHLGGGHIGVDHLGAGHLGGGGYLGGGEGEFIGGIGHHGIGAGGLGIGGLGVGLGHKIGLGGAGGGGGLGLGYGGKIIGGEEIDKSVFSGGKKNLNNGHFLKSHGNKGEELKHLGEGFSKGEELVKNLKGESGHFFDTEGGKKLYQDGKNYHGGEHFEKQGQ